MYQFYIIEIKQYPNGEYEHTVHFAYDAEPITARLKAESKYHEILSAAAISNTLKHSAVLINDESYPLLNQCYSHNLETPNQEEPLE